MVRDQQMDLDSSQIRLNSIICSLFWVSLDILRTNDTILPLIVYFNLFFFFSSVWRAVAQVWAPAWTTSPPSRSLCTPPQHRVRPTTQTNSAASSTASDLDSVNTRWVLSLHFPTLFIFQLLLFLSSHKFLFPDVRPLPLSFLSIKIQVVEYLAVLSQGEIHCSNNYQCQSLRHQWSCVHVKRRNCRLFVSLCNIFTFSFLIFHFHTSVISSRARQCECFTRICD